MEAEVEEEEETAAATRRYPPMTKTREAAGAPCGETTSL